MMLSNNPKRTIPILKIMNPAQEEKIHEATLEILEKTGIKIEHESALDLLEENGARVDREHQRAFFPREMVLEQMKIIPKEFQWNAKCSEKTVSMNSTEISFVPSIGLQIYDLDKKENRTPTRKEFYDYIRLQDSMANVDGMVSFPFWGFAKVPQVMALIESMAAKLRMSDKPQMEGSTTDDYKFIIEMAEATGHTLMLLINPTAPLTLDNPTIDKIFYAEDHNQLMHIAAGPGAGVSAPMTAAGFVAAHNALILATMIIGQIYKPGSPMIAGGFMFVSDMSTLAPSFGNLGNSLASAVFCQMWNRYGIPCSGISGAFTSSKDIDYQAGYEQTFGMLIDTICGANALMYQGGLYAELSASPEKMIIDDDIVGMAKRFLKGVEVSDETIGLDTIHQVGSAPGTFVAEEHTFEHLNEDSYNPKVADRDAYPVWLEKGKAGILGEAVAYKNKILAEPPVNKLSAEEENKIEEILQRAREYYRGLGMISDEEWKLYQGDIHSKGYPFS